MESRLLAFLSDKEQKDKNDSNIAQLKKKRRKKNLPCGFNTNVQCSNSELKGHREKKKEVTTNMSE